MTCLAASVPASRTATSSSASTSRPLPSQRVVVHAPRQDMCRRHPKSPILPLGLRAYAGARASWWEPEPQELAALLFSLIDGGQA